MNLQIVSSIWWLKMAFSRIFEVETKGMESEETQFKDRAAAVWCENASNLTDKKWRYKKVSQQKFKDLQPTNLLDLEVI